MPTGKPDPKLNQLLRPKPNQQRVKCCIDIPISHLYRCLFFPECKCSFVSLQVLLFLQKEKEESPPEAQVKEEDGENLKHCGHCQVLNGSNYTDPQPLISFQLPPHLFIPLTLFPLSLCTSPLALSLSRSQCSLATGELKEYCSPTDSTTDS